MSLGGGADGRGHDPAAFAQAAGRLAAMLGAERLTLGIDDTPDRELTDLVARAEAAAAPWLAALPLDVGAPLADGSCWAEALGAWRQATLLVISADQLGGGLPAAAHALLRQWQVPLLGLVQWGGTWEAGERLRDGLPWLGQLPGDAVAGGDEGVPEEVEVEVALAFSLALRLRKLQES